MDQTTPTPEIDPADDLELPTQGGEQEQDPVLAEYQTAEMQALWKEELDASRENRRKFDDNAVHTIKRYGDERHGDVKLNTNRYNLFFANTDIKLSALYSRTPEPDIRRRFLDADDSVGRVAANIAQRAAFVELEQDGFDQKFKQMLFDYLVPGMGVGWVRYEEEYTDPQTTTQQGIDPTTGEMTTVEIVIPPQLKEQTTPIDYVAWDDIIWAPCQVWTSCRWVARRLSLTKAAFMDRFQSRLPADFDVENITFTTKEGNYGGTQNPNPTDQLKPQKVIEKTTDVYEVWDKERRLVWWVNEHAPMPLDVVKDTNELPGFFPTPLPPMGRYTTSSTLPKSDYFLSKDLYQTLDDLQARAVDLIDCIQVRFVYDATFDELKNLYTTVGPNKGIGVKNWGAFQGDKGGMAHSIEFAPLAPYATALQTTLQNLQIIKQEIYDIEGIADFMRGQTQPYDSAAAITQKGNFAPSRLGQSQKMVARYVEDLVRLKVFLMTKFYKPEVLVDHAGALPAADKQFIGQAVQLLQAGFNMNFRLSVSVDAIQDARWNIEKAERTQVVQAIGELLNMSGAALERTPQLAPFISEVIKWSIAGFKGSQGIEGVLDAAMGQLAALAKKPPPQQPNPAVIKAQSEQQKNQTQLQISSQQEETKRMELQQESAESQVQVMLKQMQMKIDAIEAAVQLKHAVHDKAHDVAMDVATLGQQ